MNFTINRIQHTGIPVTDLSRSVAFYEKLGFLPVMNSIFQYHGGTGNVTMMQQNDMVIELYQLPDSDLPEIVNRGNGHIDHIAFDVTDIDEVFRELTLNGFTIMEAGPVFLPFWENGCRYFNITGPDGERLEFNQIL